MQNIGYWVYRALLNIRGFLAATLAMFLPSAAPIFSKLIAGWLGKGAQIVNLWIGIEADWNPVIMVAVAGIIGVLEQAAIWRAPNQLPTAAQKRNPIVGTATDVPPA